MATPNQQKGPKVMTKQHFDYIAEAHVTASDQFRGELLPLDYLTGVLFDAITALRHLDDVKKCLFYGRVFRDFSNFHFGKDCLGVEEWISENSDDAQNSINIIHGIIGKATEAGELLELLHNTIHKGEPFDKINAAEEIGDGFWYDALIARACGYNFEQIQRINIQKLRKRFPDSFTAFDANNRDLFLERGILETIETASEEKFNHEINCNFENKTNLENLEEKTVLLHKFVDYIKRNPESLEFSAIRLVSYFYRSLETLDNK